MAIERFRNYDDMSGHKYIDLDPDKADSGETDDGAADNFGEALLEALPDGVNIRLLDDGTRVFEFPPDEDEPTPLPDDPEPDPR